MFTIRFTDAANIIVRAQHKPAVNKYVKEMLGNCKVDWAGNNAATIINGEGKFIAYVFKGIKPDLPRLYETEQQAKDYFEPDADNLEKVVQCGNCDFWSISKGDRDGGAIIGPYVIDGHKVLDICCSDCRMLKPNELNKPVLF